MSIGSGRFLASKLIEEIEKEGNFVDRSRINASGLQYCHSLAIWMQVKSCIWSTREKLTRGPEFRRTSDKRISSHGVHHHHNSSVWRTVNKFVAAARPSRGGTSAY